MKACLYSLHARSSKTDYTPLAHFSWVLQRCLCKIWGANKVHYGRCVSGVCSGIHAVDFGFQVLDTGFFQSVKLRFWILKTRIPHSTSKNLLLFGFPHKSSLDSGIRLSLYGRLNIPPFGIFYKKKLFPFSLPSTLMTNPKPLDTASPVIWFHHSFTA